VKPNGGGINRPRVVTAHESVWSKADMPKNAIDVAFGGKADMVFCGANVR